VIDKHWWNVRLACIQELGYALMYMDYIHPSPDWGPQRSRVLTLCEECGQHNSIEHKNEDKYWNDLYWRISDEIENMC